MKSRDVHCGVFALVRACARVESCVTCELVDLRLLSARVELYRCTIEKVKCPGQTWLILHVWR